MISIENGRHKKFNFPAGERHIIIEEINTSPVNIEFEYEKDAEIFELMLLVDAVKRNGFDLGELTLDYVPYGRQDRVTQHGEPVSIKVFSDVINSLNFTKVRIMDAHSAVTTASLERCEEIQQSELFLNFNVVDCEHYLISPDGGALKKIYGCVTDKTIDVIECSKKRNVKTGEITCTKVYFEDFKNKTCVIVDDICDGGRTFIEIAKVLKRKNAGEVILFVTHGLFTKGLKVFDNLIDEIYTKEGRVK